MQEYKARHIQFVEVREIGDWRIKVYTISKNEYFDFPDFYRAALRQLPKWLEMHNSFDAQNDKQAFLILHAGTEGIFSLINWWVGSNMLNSHVFFTEYNDLGNFKKISGDGLTACVWELEIINHERNAWMKYILKQVQQPDYRSYLRDTFSTVL